ncbi:NAD(P)-dependent oxidoreductase [Marinobacter fonticola]|uniref:NAD(P)-dependent oxidoreductase n=1 Tax=Marinobacter fonticola TaxID=2603215 RepID=UPI0011E6883B|nr:NAD(P)-dependent oxidoreductase [Marinobacter fonticola]
MTTQPHIAFLGIGLMGAPMVENLLNAGYTMTLWNRTRAKCEPFAERARVVDSPAQAAQQADILITMLENGAVVHDVMVEQGVIDQLPPGAIVIDMSSVQPATARDHASRCEENSAAYLDAPVSGGTVGAAAGSLSIMVGGEAEIVDKARPVLETLGRVTHIGPSGSGQLAKLANQAVVGITIGAVSEALLLAAQGGADPAAVREALMGGFASSRILDLHGQRMIDRQFEPGAPSRIQLKDMRMILDEARAEGLTLPLAQSVHDQYLSLLADGQGETDHSGLLLALEHLNGVQLTQPDLPARARSQTGK